MSAPYSPVVGYVVPDGPSTGTHVCDVCIDEHEVDTAHPLRAAEVRPGRHCERCDEEL